MAYELPSSLRELSEVIGYKAMAKLASARGGMEVFIPQKISENCFLAQIIGVEAAEKMLDYYGYGHLKIAQGCFRGTRGRKQLGKILLKEGFSLAEVARKVDVSIRTVEGWRSKEEKNEKLPLLDMMNIRD